MLCTLDDPIDLYQLPSDRYPVGANREARESHGAIDVGIEESFSQ
jgi:hypothetical protein